MKSRSLLFAGIVLGALICLTIAVFEGPQWSAELGLSEKEAVLVFVIPRIEQARSVRKAVDPGRIVWEGREGLALAGGQVVALNFDQAGEVIEKAGWVDRPIQIVRLDDPSTEAGKGGETGTTADRAARADRLRSLVNKPTLSRGEQLFVLSAMNDGIEL